MTNSICADTPTFLNLVNLAESAGVQVKSGGRGKGGGGLTPSSKTTGSDPGGEVAEVSVAKFRYLMKAGGSRESRD